MWQHSWNISWRILISRLMTAFFLSNGRDLRYENLTGISLIPMSTAATKCVMTAYEVHITKEQVLEKENVASFVKYFLMHRHFSIIDVFLALKSKRSWISKFDSHFFDSDEHWSYKVSHDRISGRHNERATFLKKEMWQHSTNISWPLGISRLLMSVFAFKWTRSWIWKFDRHIFDFDEHCM